MRISKSGGHIIHDPISFAFSMIEEGGSSIQQYDSIAGEWVPDRRIAPMRFTPTLSVSDPNGSISTGEHNEMLTDCRWVLDGKLLNSDSEISINNDTHALTFGKNLNVSESSELVFTASVYDAKRGETSPVKWSKVLSCQPTTSANIKMRAVSQGKMMLDPFKDRDIFEIEVQLYNGDKLIPDAEAVFQWQKFDGISAWTEVNGDDLWCRGGAKTRKILVCQRYVQVLRLRCIAHAKAFPTFTRFETFMLKRYYGQYHHELLWLEGKYKLPNTIRARAEVQVSRYNAGAVANPEVFFDIETFYSRSKYQGFFHVSHTSKAEVTSADFGDDDTAQHCFGYLVREKSAFQPITIGGKVLTINGAAVCTQVPTATREVD